MGEEEEEEAEEQEPVEVTVSGVKKGKGFEVDITGYERSMDGEI